MVKTGDIVLVTSGARRGTHGTVVGVDSRGLILSFNVYGSFDVVEFLKYEYLDMKKGVNNYMPTRYRKKPVEIEAFQWKGESPDNAPKWFTDAVKSGVIKCYSGIKDVSIAELYIKTLEGDMTARPDDWIIRGVAGEIYPCKPDIFARTYEPVVE